MTLSTQLHKVKPAEIKMIYKIEKQCFDQESFSYRQLYYLGTKAKSDFLVTKHEEKISSYIILLKRRKSSMLRIYSIAVAPGFRGKGLARILLNEAEKIASKSGYKYLSLEVSELNSIAVNLYLKSGFEVYGERLAYYKDGSKALLMRKEIQD